jgi:hypothetical protein
MLTENLRKQGAEENIRTKRKEISFPLSSVFEQTLLSEASGFRRGVHEVFTLFGFCIVYVGVVYRCFRTFCRSILQGPSNPRMDY